MSKHLLCALVVSAAVSVSACGEKSRLSAVDSNTSESAASAGQAAASDANGTEKSSLNGAGHTYRTEDKRPAPSELLQWSRAERSLEEQERLFTQCELLTVKADWEACVVTHITAMNKAAAELAEGLEP